MTLQNQIIVHLVTVYVTICFLNIRNKYLSNILPHVCLCKFNILYLQAVPSFPSSFPHLFSGKDKLRCLIPCAIDQVIMVAIFVYYFSVHSPLCIKSQNFSIVFG